MQQLSGTFFGSRQVKMIATTQVMVGIDLEALFARSYPDLPFSWETNKLRLYRYGYSEVNFGNRDIVREAQLQAEVLGLGSSGCEDQKSRLPLFDV